MYVCISKNVAQYETLLNTFIMHLCFDSLPIFLNKINTSKRTNPNFWDMRNK